MTTKLSFKKIVQLIERCFMSSIVLLILFSLTVILTVLAPFVFLISLMKKYNRSIK